MVADLSWRDGQIPEVRHGSWLEPQCDPAPRVCARLDVVDHQSRLFAPVDVEPCSLAVHLDPDRRPIPRDEVDIRFVPARCLLAEAVPRPFRMRDVLHRMIAAFLVPGTTVRRAQVERVVRLSVLLHAKGDADEAAGTLP